MENILNFITEHWFIVYLMFTTLIAIIAALFDKTEITLGTNEYGRITAFIISLFVLPIILPFMILIGGAMLFFGLVFLIMMVISILIGVVEALLFRN